MIALFFTCIRLHCSFLHLPGLWLIQEMPRCQDSVRNLCVLFDSNLSFDSQVSSICKTDFFHLKNIAKLRPMFSMSNAEMLINAFMTSWLDYCNALLGGCSGRLINKLQMVQNAAARVITRTRKYDHISPVLPTLHWLPIKHRIDLKNLVNYL